MRKKLKPYWNDTQKLKFKYFLLVLVLLLNFFKCMFREKKLAIAWNTIYVIISINKLIFIIIKQLTNAINNFTWIMIFKYLQIMNKFFFLHEFLHDFPICMISLILQTTIGKILQFVWYKYLLDFIICMVWCNIIEEIMMKEHKVRNKY